MKPITSRRRAAVRRSLPFMAGMVVAWLAAFPTPTGAQCALDVRARPGATGYQQRDYGCEGLYVQLQAASINIQVISLVKGALPLDAENVVQIHVPPTLTGLRESVAIAGRGREANLNWALDGFARPGRPMTWRLRAVVRQIPLEASRIGVFGQTVKASGLGGPIYVPVAVRAPGEEPRDNGGYELVIRIPLAGAAQWRLGSEGEWRQDRPVDGDGFFAFHLPPETSGETDFEIRWAPRGTRDFGAPESLRILFW
jgi:hypothetical protein